MPGNEGEPVNPARRLKLTETWSKLATTLTNHDWAVLTLPENSLERRQILQNFNAQGYDYVIRYSNRYELFREEEHQAARVRATIAETSSCPVNGKLRVGNGDNLCWFI